MSKLDKRIARQRQRGCGTGEDRGVSATWLKEPQISNCTSGGDFAVSILQADLLLLQRRRRAAEAIQ